MQSLGAFCGQVCSIVANRVMPSTGQMYRSSQSMQPFSVAMPVKGLHVPCGHGMQNTDSSGSSPG